MKKLFLIVGLLSSLNSMADVHDKQYFIHDSDLAIRSNHWEVCDTVSTLLKDGTYADKNNPMSCKLVSKFSSQLITIRETQSESTLGGSGSGYIVKVKPANPRLVLIANGETKYGMSLTQILLPVVDGKELVGIQTGSEYFCDYKVAGSTCSLVYGEEIQTERGAFRQVTIKN